MVPHLIQLAALSLPKRHPGKQKATIPTNGALPSFPFTHAVTNLLYVIYSIYLVTISLGNGFYINDHLVACSLASVTMLRASLRKSGGRLCGGASASRSLSTSNGLNHPTTPVSGSCGFNLVSKRRALAITSYGTQRRCYAIAAEDTDKGVVSIIRAFARCSVFSQRG